MLTEILRSSSNSIHIHIILFPAVRLQIHVAATGLLSYLVEEKGGFPGISPPACEERVAALIQYPCPFLPQLEALEEQQPSWLTPDFKAGTEEHGRQAATNYQSGFPSK